MTDSAPLGTLSPPPAAAPSSPWTLRDTWIGFAFFLALVVGIGVLAGRIPAGSPWLWFWFLLYQPAQFIPVAVVLVLRRAGLADLGLRRAAPNVLGLGCGLLILLMALNMVNNLVMVALGVEIQAEQFSSLAGLVDHPAVLLITAAFLAPLFEELTFRAFLFGGLRGRLGWKRAAILSSLIFAAGHLQLAALIPTFALGFLFAYLYERSGSLWPAIILHTLVNSFSMCAILVLTEYGGPIVF